MIRACNNNVLKEASNSCWRNSEVWKKKEKNETGRIQGIRRVFLRRNV